MKRNKAFSLLEVSVIIIILGVLLAGVVKGIGFYDQSSNKFAQTVTKSSPMYAGTISGLLMWYETTLDESFKNSERSDGLAISEWRDVKPKNFGSAYNATQPTANLRPTYVKNSFGPGVPGIKFTNKGLYTSSITVPGAKTIFIVAKVNDGATTPYYALSSNGVNRFGVTAGVGGFGCLTGNSSGWTNTSAETPAATNIKPKKSVILVCAADETSYSPYVNGVALNSVGAGSGDYTGPVVIGARITTVDYAFDGEIGEIIVYDSVLSDKQRKKIEKYLVQKYNIEGYGG